MSPTIHRRDPVRRRAPRRREQADEDQVVAEVGQDGDQASEPDDQDAPEARVQEDLHASRVGRPRRVVGVGEAEDQGRGHHTGREPPPAVGPVPHPDGQKGKRQHPEEGLLPHPRLHGHRHRRHPRHRRRDEVGVVQELRRNPPPQDVARHQVEDGHVRQGDEGHHVAGRHPSGHCPGAAVIPGAPPVHVLGERVPRRRLRRRNREAHHQRQPRAAQDGAHDLHGEEGGGRRGRVVSEPAPRKLIEPRGHDEHAHRGPQGQGGQPTHGALEGVPAERHHPQHEEDQQPQLGQEGQQVVGGPHLAVAPAERLGDHHVGASHGREVPRNDHVHADGRLGDPAIPPLEGVGAVDAAACLLGLVRGRGEAPECRVLSEPRAHDLPGQEEAFLLAQGRPLVGLGQHPAEAHEAAVGREGHARLVGIPGYEGPHVPRPDRDVPSLRQGVEGVAPPAGEIHVSPEGVVGLETHRGAGAGGCQVVDGEERVGPLERHLPRHPRAQVQDRHGARERPCRDAGGNDGDEAEPEARTANLRGIVHLPWGWATLSGAS